MPQDTPSRKLDQYIVRFPQGMRERLKVIAAQNGRSLNAEIVQRLEDSLETDLVAADPALSIQALEPLIAAFAQHVQESSLGRMEIMLGTIAQLLLEKGGLDDASRSEVTQVVTSIHARLEEREDAADAAKYAQVKASTPPEQLSTDHLRPKGKK